MKRMVTQVTGPAARTVVVALLATLALASAARAATGDLASTLTARTGSAPVMLAQATAPPAPPATSPGPGPRPAAKASRADRVEARITKLHATLKITPAQEDLWKNVTEVMRDNAQTMEALTKARADKATTMTAVDDLNSYSEIAAAHADGLKKFVPVFEALYASMSDGQKAQANTLFRGHQRSRTAAKAKAKSPASASTGTSTK